MELAEFTLVGTSSRLGRTLRCSRGWGWGGLPDELEGVRVKAGAAGTRSKLAEQFNIRQGRHGEFVFQLGPFRGRGNHFGMALSGHAQGDTAVGDAIADLQAAGLHP